MPDRDGRSSHRGPSGSRRAGGWFRLGVFLAALLGPTVVLGAGPADSLFRLIPPGSSAIFAVEDFRDRAKEVEASSLDDELRRLPLVASWLASDRLNRFVRASNRIEVGLGVPIRTVLDEILGDAVVLVLQPGPDDLVAQSSGLLLIKPRQRKLLERLLETRNAAQSQRGQLVQVETRRRGAITYQSRRFRPAGWPSDHYVFFDDGTFAWSNSEATILEVIDNRIAARPGWSSAPSFARLRAGLPEHALASLFVAPKVVSRVVTTALPPTTPAARTFNRMAVSYFDAVQATGLALEWRDGFLLHAVDVLDPARLPPWLAAGMAHPTPPAPLLANVPAAAFGVISARFDYVGVLRAIRTLVVEEDRAGWATAERAVQGLALGRALDDLLAQVEPHLLMVLGPRLDPDQRSWATLLAATTWRESARDSAPWLAVDNGFKTAMALFTLRPHRRALSWEFETKTINQRPVARVGPRDRSVFAMQADPDRFLASNSAEAIGQFANSPGITPLDAPLAALRAKYATDAATFAMFDLPRLTDAVIQSRNLIVRDLANRSGRPVAEVDRDLGQFLALAQLFKAAVFTSNSSPDATAVHRTIGLIAR